MATSCVNNHQLLVGFLATSLRAKVWQGPGDALPALPQFWGRRHELHRKLSSNNDVCFPTCSQPVLCTGCSSAEAQGRVEMTHVGFYPQPKHLWEVG